MQAAVGESNCVAMKNGVLTPELVKRVALPVGSNFSMVSLPALAAYKLPVRSNAKPIAKFKPELAKVEAFPAESTLLIVLSPALATKRLPLLSNARPFGELNPDAE